MGTVTRKPWTVEELNLLPAGWRYEIDEGELVIMTPASWRHGKITNRVAFVLSQFVYQYRSGEVVAGEPGVLLRRVPDVLRAPDVAYYSAERVARIGDTRGFATVPPDQAVEVHDVGEPDLSRKIRQYLAAGVQAVWVLNPETGTLTRHAPGEEPQTWADPDDVVVEPVIPGFSCRLQVLFGVE